MCANGNVVPLDDVRPATLVAEVKDDISRNRMRDRLQVLEGWKIEADETELSLIHRHEAYLQSLLEETYWSEKAKDRREEFKEEDARSRGEIS
jgi:hypothetical protein